MAVLYSYKLKRPCGYMRPFCRRCVNTFSIDTCGPGDCGTRPPSTVCLVPFVGGFIDAGNCGQFPDCGQTMPEIWLCKIEWEETANREPGTAGSVTFLAETQVMVDSQFPLICGIQGCGFQTSFNSADYPLVPGDYNPERVFSICATIGSGGILVHVNREILTGNGRDGAFFFTDSWNVDANPSDAFGDKCTDYNQTTSILFSTTDGSVIRLTLFPYVSG